MTVVLSESERHRLAEIDEYLVADDPRLARMFTDWSVRPPRLRMSWLVTTGTGSVAASLTGVALGGTDLSVALIVLGSLGVCLALIAGTRPFRRVQRAAESPDPTPGNGWWSGTESERPWISWWCW